MGKEGESSGGTVVARSAVTTHASAYAGGASLVSPAVQEELARPPRPLSRRALTAPTRSLRSLNRGPSSVHDRSAAHNCRAAPLSPASSDFDASKCPSHVEALRSF